MNKSTVIAIFLLLITTLVFATVPEIEAIRLYYTLDAADTEFIFTQPVNSSDDIQVYKKLITTGAETPLAITTDYEIDPAVGGYLDGGTVTISPALGITFQVVIVREIKKSQETSQGATTPLSVMLSLDKLTRIVQDLEDRKDRSWHLPESDAESFSMVIPTLSLRASSFPFFDPDGNLTYVAGVSENTISTSTFGDSLIIAADAAAGATVLELGTLNNVEFAGITGTTGTFSEAIAAAATITLGSGADLIGAANSVINFNGFDVAANGDTVIGGTLEVGGTLLSTGIATLADSSQLATSASPTTDVDIANKKYVDDKTGTVGNVNPLDYQAVAGESIVFANGLILKMGTVVDGTASGEVVFGGVGTETPFPTGIVSVVTTSIGNVAHNEQYQVNVQTVDSFTWLHSVISGVTGFNWIAIGY